MNNEPLLQGYLPMKQLHEKTKLNNTSKTSIADNLAKLLLQHHLNINQLASRLQLPMMTLRRLLSGETTDPRISTLTLIANYFNIPVDILISAHKTSANHMTQNAYTVPLLEYEHLPAWIANPKDFLTKNTVACINICNNTPLHPNTFALESTPSMYGRFPKGTIFVLDPAATPTDGDLVLIKLQTKDAFTLRELSIDSQDYHCIPLTPHAPFFHFSTKKHKIIGVTLLTMLYNKSRERT